MSRHLYRAFFLSWTFDTGQCFLVEDCHLTIAVPALDNLNLAGAWLALAY